MQKYPLEVESSPENLPVTDEQRLVINKILGPWLTKIFDSRTLAHFYAQGRYVFTLGTQQNILIGGSTPEEAWDLFLIELLRHRRQAPWTSSSEYVLLPAGSDAQPQITDAQIDAVINLLGLDFIQSNPRYNPIHLAAYSNHGTPFYRLGPLELQDPRSPAQNWAEAWIDMLDLLHAHTAPASDICAEIRVQIANTSSDLL